MPLKGNRAKEIPNKNDKALRLEQKTTFTISKQEDVNKLIAILDKYGPLNTTKYLDFLSWKKAFLLYISSKEKSTIEKEIIKSEILMLKNNNNRGRTDFAMSTNHNIVIKPYWLLGFIVGEGCFSIQKHAKYLTIITSFILTQTVEQMPVMEAIQTFLNNLEPSSDTKVKLIVQKKKTQNAKPTIRVYVPDYSFITNYLIPFLEGLSFSSIKELDSLDWKSVIQIKALKKHLTEEGSEVIKQTISRMNRNRRSTAFKNSSNELNFNLFNNNLDANISKLLQESNKNHPVFIPGLTKSIPVWLYDKGELIEGSPFLSISHCVKSLKHLGFSLHINNIKDTGKLYKNRYTIYSKPLLDSKT